MTDELEHGPGWAMDPSTLRPRITDRDAFLADRPDDPLAEVLALLWGGEPAAAEQALSAMPQDFRARRLRAEAASRLGRHDEAVDALRSMLGATGDPARLAHLEQHLGIALLAAGRRDEAAQALGQALTRRLATTSGAADLATLRQGVRLARGGAAG